MAPLELAPRPYDTFMKPAPQSSFGDVQDDAAKSLLSSIGNPPTITYLHTDVTKYTDNLKLFKTALEKYGRVDHACPIAGIIESGRWFDPNLTIETVEQEESRATIDAQPDWHGHVRQNRRSVPPSRKEGRGGQELNLDQ